LFSRLLRLGGEAKHYKQSGWKKNKKCFVTELPNQKYKI